MKKNIIISLLLLISNLLLAQKQDFLKDIHREYEEFANHTHNEYKSFRAKQNAEFADLMKQRWSEFKSFASIKNPKSQEPPTPVVKTNKTPSPTKEIRYKLVLTLVPYEVPDPIEPIIVPIEEEKATFNFTFHGTPCSVTLTDDMKFSLPDASEQSASETWESLSTTKYDALIKDCLYLRNNLQLGDWGYIKLLQSMTSGYFGNNSNEAVLLQMYILIQSGYKVRIARSNQKLVLLIPCESDIYSYSYIEKDNLKYYILDNVDTSSTYYVFDKAFPNEHIMSIQLTNAPALAFAPTKQRTLTSMRYPNIQVALQENNNLIEFYNEYPCSSKWDFYSKTSLSRETKNAIYPILKKELNNASPLEKVNMLLNFVQTSLKYKTDQEQFGYERPLFGDETLYYPYSDCEDRSILFSILVQDLLGYKVVLLNYTTHLATAVQIPSNEVYGYYFLLDGKKYAICDPTYINADVGDCMPEFINESPNIIKLETK